MHEHDGNLARLERLAHVDAFLAFVARGTDEIVDRGAAFERVGVGDRGGEIAGEWQAGVGASQLRSGS